MKLLGFSSGIFFQAVLVLLFGWAPLSVATAVSIDPDSSMAQVKSLACKDNSTVEQALDQSIRSHSQRDIGWRVFQEQDFVDVERAVLVNKAKEFRYRWRVAVGGAISAISDKAQKLCLAESE